MSKRPVRELACRKILCQTKRVPVAYPEEAGIGGSMQGCGGHGAGHGNGSGQGIGGGQ